MVDSNENLHSPVTSDSSHKVSSSAVHHKLGQDNQLNSKAVDNSTLVMKNDKHKNKDLFYQSRLEKFKIIT